jgi:hypothetical protein
MHSTLKCTFSCPQFSLEFYAKKIICFLKIKNNIAFSELLKKWFELHYLQIMDTVRTTARSRAWATRRTSLTTRSFRAAQPAAAAVVGLVAAPDSPAAT